MAKEDYKRLMEFDFGRSCPFYFLWEPFAVEFLDHKSTTTVGKENMCKAGWDKMKTCFKSIEKATSNKYKNAQTGQAHTSILVLISISDSSTWCKLEELH